MRRGLLFSGEHFQPPALHPTPRVPIKFRTDHIECAVRLGRVKDVPSDRPGNQVRELKAANIRCLGNEPRDESQNLPVVHSGAIHMGQAYLAGDELGQ